MNGIDPDVEGYLAHVVRTLQRDLGDGLVGVYLHGSLAMGAFDPGRSDVDVLAVCSAPVPPARSIAVGEALAAIPRPPSGGDLESSLVTEAAVRGSSAAPPFEVHVSTHEDTPVVDGHGRAGDEDLVIHFAMTRARGRALTGPAPAELFPEADRASLIGAFLSDLDWARELGAAGWEGHRMPELASMAYRVLNASRSWRYVETGDLGSKVEGAAWLRHREPADPQLHALLDAVLSFQRGETPDRPNERAVDALVDRVEAILRKAIA